jgi:hypothetical protein
MEKYKMFQTTNQNIYISNDMFQAPYGLHAPLLGLQFSSKLLEASWLLVGMSLLPMGFDQSLDNCGLWDL